MFSVYCRTAGSEVLLDSGHIERLGTRDGQLVVAYRCSCGERGVWRPARAAGASAPPTARRAG